MGGWGGAAEGCVWMDGLGWVLGQSCCADGCGTPYMGDVGEGLGVGAVAVGCRCRTWDRSMYVDISARRSAGGRRPPVSHSPRRCCQATADVAALGSRHTQSTWSVALRPSQGRTTSHCTTRATAAAATAATRPAAKPAKKRPTASPVLVMDGEAPAEAMPQAPGPVPLGAGGRRLLEGKDACHYQAIQAMQASK